jgi:NIPSNAP
VGGGTLIVDAATTVPATRAPSRTWAGSVSAVLDLRTYKLVPGGLESFDRIFREGALPMLGRHEIDVVGYGPSLADAEHYYLARAFPSAARREQQLDAFYGSEEWRQRYERAVMELIETYHTVVIPLTSAPHALGGNGQTHAWTQTHPPSRRS